MVIRYSNKVLLGLDGMFQDYMFGHETPERFRAHPKASIPHQGALRPVAYVSSPSYYNHEERSGAVPLVPFFF